MSAATACYSHVTGIVHQGFHQVCDLSKTRLSGGPGRVQATFSTSLESAAVLQNKRKLWQIACDTKACNGQVSIESSPQLKRTDGLSH